ncbi:MAG: glycogen debranching protein, partial [Muricauda sp.]|nr:glycogen debranching protein [Allomuricauda sp.]
MKFPFYIIFLSLIAACSNPTPQPWSQILESSSSISGKEDYLGSPYVTAGNRTYMVGHQDGTFPPLGWHIKGEMGGIWDHPIKLMDGFDANLIIGMDTLHLNKATQFINYPFANKHVFEYPEKNIIVERFQYVPDDHQGIAIQFSITSKQNSTPATFQFVGHTDLRPPWLGERTQMLDGKDSSVFESNKWIIKDGGNPWFNIFGSNQQPTG